MTTKAHSMRAVSQTLDAGSAVIESASGALQATISVLGDIRTCLRGAQSSSRTIRAALAPNLQRLRDRLHALAAGAAVGGINLLVLEGHGEGDMVSIGSAVARNASGDIMVRPIAIDRAAVALFDAAREASASRGILDRVDAASGTSIVGIDLAHGHGSEAFDSLENLILQVEAGTANVRAAASHLSIVRSRLTLQSSFISSLTDVPPVDLASRVFQDLDHDALRRRALDTRRLLNEQPLGIANLNRETVLRLLREG